MGRARIYIAEQFVGLADEAVLLEAMRRMHGKFSVTRVGESILEFRADFQAMSSPGGQFLLDHLETPGESGKR